MPLTGVLPESADLDDADAGEHDGESGSPAASARPFVIDAARLRALQEEHFEFLWRSLRRLGVPEADVDDAVQQVFLVAARRTIQPGAERSFLFATALRVASHARRTRRRRREADEPVPEQTDATPSPEELLDQRRARALLDEVLEALPLDLRAVFILFELEEMTVVEIAAMLGIPSGTAASRLRRGRELFQQTVARVRANAQRRQP
jgi:RNA polymerase sigma-70 factor, ECF subfamily